MSCRGIGGRKADACAVVRSWRQIRAPLGKLRDLDVPECYRELLVLQADVPFRESRVANVERRLAVQFNDEMIAVRGDLIAVPLIRFERVLARGLRGTDDGAGVVAGRLLSPDLDLVAAVLLRRAHEHAAVRVDAAPELDREDEVLVAAIGRQVSSGRTARRQRSIDDFPMRGAGRR